jgi:hypothetical protein
MKTIKALTIFVILFFAASASAQIEEFSEATGSGTGEFGGSAKWEFTSGTDTYEIIGNGRGERRDSQNKVTAFKLPLAKSESISNRVYWAKYETDLVIVYEVSEGGYGGGTIIRLNGTTLKPRWPAANIGGFNVALGIIDGQDAYIAASGFAGRLDLDTGKYLWKHDDLYRKFDKNGAFNIFEMPELDGETVIFTEKVEGKEPNYLVMDKATGRVMRSVVN